MKGADSPSMADLRPTQATVFLKWMSVLEGTTREIGGGGALGEGLGNWGFERGHFFGGRVCCFINRSRT